MCRFCGLWSKLSKRIARGDKGINPLDSACKGHDITYSENQTNIEARNKADLFLANKAWERVKSTDAGIGEKAAALAVTNIMKIKSKLGMGYLLKKSKFKKKQAIKKKKKGGNIPFRNIVAAAEKAMIKNKNANIVISTALKGARKLVKKAGGKNKIKKLRVLSLPQKNGGVLPLIPIFAELSTLGTLVGGITGVAKTINDFNIAKKKLEESKTHNQVM